ncbi:unnamed protein product [Caretta caretta]
MASLRGGRGGNAASRLVGGTRRATLCSGGTERGSIKGWPSSSVKSELQKETDASSLLLEWDAKENCCCLEDQPELPESPATPDAEELLPLPLAEYPGEPEDDPWMQVSLDSNEAQKSSQSS